MGPLAQSVRELKIPPDLSAFTPPATENTKFGGRAYIQAEYFSQKTGFPVHHYLEAIASAREEIIIANAYFLPGIRFRRALGNAAGRGVRVVLLLQGRVEYMLMHYASRALYGTLLDAGVEIHEYHKSFMHAKVAVIDGSWATVGSSNIDPFSLTLAREANIVVVDPVFAGELRTSLLQAIKIGTIHVAKTSWHRQSLWKKLPIWLAYSVVRVLLGMVGYAEKH